MPPVIARVAAFSASHRWLLLAHRAKLSQVHCGGEATFQTVARAASQLQRGTTVGPEQAPPTPAGWRPDERVRSASPARTTNRGRGDARPAAGPPVPLVCRSRTSAANRSRHRQQRLPRLVARPPGRPASGHPPAPRIRSARLDLPNHRDQPPATARRPPPHTPALARSGGRGTQATARRAVSRRVKQLTLTRATCGWPTSLRSGSYLPPPPLNLLAGRIRVAPWRITTSRNRTGVTASDSRWSAIDGGTYGRQRLVDQSVSWFALPAESTGNAPVPAGRPRRTLPRQRACPVLGSSTVRTSAPPRVWSPSAPPPGPGSAAVAAIHSSAASTLRYLGDRCWRRHRSSRRVRAPRHRPRPRHVAWQVPDPASVVHLYLGSFISTSRSGIGPPSEAPIPDRHPSGMDSHLRQ